MTLSTFFYNVKREWREKEKQPSLACKKNASMDAQTKSNNNKIPETSLFMWGSTPASGKHVPYPLLALAVR